MLAVISEAKAASPEASSAEQNEKMYNNYSDTGIKSDNPLLAGGIEKRYNINDICELGENKEQLDIYTQDLIKEIKNIEINVEGIGNVKAEALIPNLEKYIEDNRTNTEKRADILYPSMKTENPIVTDIKLAGKIFPYFAERLNIELEARGKEKVAAMEILNSLEYENFTQDLFKGLRALKNYYGDSFNAAKDVNKFLKYMEGNKENPTKEELKRQEDLKEMINDFINGGDLSMLAASSKYFGNIPDAAALLRISGKNSSLDISYTKKAKKYNSAYELPKKFHDIIIPKLESQGFSADTKGLYFNSDSELSKRIAASPQIIDKIKGKKDNIKLFCDYNSTSKPISLYSETSVEYKPGENKNLYYAFHSADIHNLKYDIFGNISGDLIDTTDYNKGKSEPILVQKARELQDAGIIEPKFLIVHFVIPREIFIWEIINGENNKK